MHSKRAIDTVACHQADKALADLGGNGPLRGIGLRGRMMARFFSDTRFTAPPATFYLEDGQRLDEYGVARRIVHPPGHTPGSVTLLLDSGAAIAGDVLMGGELGGKLLARRPNLHRAKH